MTDDTEESQVKGLVVLPQVIDEVFHRANADLQADPTR